MNGSTRQFLKTPRLLQSKSRRPLFRLRKMHSRRSSATGRNHTTDCPCREASLQNCGASRVHAKHYFGRFIQENVAPRTAAARAVRSCNSVSDSAMIEKPEPRRLPAALVARKALSTSKGHSYSSSVQVPFGRIRTSAPDSLFPVFTSRKGGRE